MSGKTYQITLPDGLGRYVEERVEQGFFRDESEVVADVLRRIIHDDARLTFWAEDHVQAHAVGQVGMCWRKSFEHGLQQRDDLAKGFVCIDDDEIVPVRIVHDMEEIYQNGRVEQRYNFMDYHFEGEGAHIRARHYVSSRSKVTIYGPYASPESQETVVAPEFARKVRAYLDRRFAHVSIPDPIPR